MTTTTTHTDPYEMFEDAGLVPADDCEVGWIRERFSAVAELLTGGYLAGSIVDNEVVLLVLTASGVVRSQMRFPVDGFGRVAMVAAVDAVAQALLDGVVS